MNRRAFLAAAALSAGANERRIDPAGVRFIHVWNSTGLLADFGIRQLDAVHQIMSAGMPVSVSATGTREALQVIFDYQDFLVSYESSTMNDDSGIAFYGSRGSVFLEDQHATASAKSMFAAHLGNLAFRTGQRLTQPKIAMLEMMIGTPEV